MFTSIETRASVSSITREAPDFNHTWRRSALSICRLTPNASKSGSAAKCRFTFLKDRLEIAPTRSRTRFSASSLSTNTSSTSSVRKSRTDLSTKSGSSNKTAGACLVFIPSSTFLHCSKRSAKSRTKYRAWSPSPFVRKITPIPSGTSNSCRIFRKRLRSSGSSILRDTPLISPNGISTRYRPGKLKFVVTRAPLVPIGPLFTCTITSAPGG